MCRAPAGGTCRLTLADRARLGSAVWRPVRRFRCRPNAELPLTFVDASLVDGDVDRPNCGRGIDTAILEAIDKSSRSCQL